MKGLIKSPEEPMEVGMEAEDRIINGSKNEADSNKDVDQLTLEDIREQIRFIEKAISTKEMNYISRVVRNIPITRRKLNHNVLRGLVQEYFPNPSKEKQYLMEFLPEAMDTDSQIPSIRPRPGKINSQPLPEVEVYLHLLLLIFLLDEKRYDSATKCSTDLVRRIASINRRSMDLLASRCYFYHSRSFELDGRFEEVRAFFHKRLCSATLRQNSDSKAVLINLLLRNYLHHNLHEQAYRIMNNTKFPEGVANNECSRYSYYTGWIHAIRLDYPDAHREVVSALRKAPQRTAVGFKQAVHKLNIVIELLLGNPPDRSIFRQEAYRKALQPYFELTQAVKAGDMGRFDEVRKQHKTQFSNDHTYTLILRLHNIVINTRLRDIAASYSRISVPDVASKLQQNSKDTEFILAKAIRNNVIDASIDHGKQYVNTKETRDLYSTQEPSLQFHKRIHRCLSLHNQAVKAMRYPQKRYDKDIETAEEHREREEQEMETAKEMAEEDADGFP